MSKTPDRREERIARAGRAVGRGRVESNHAGRQRRSSASDVCAVILAGGNGSRAGGRIPKQLHPLRCGRTVLDLCLATYEAMREVDAIAVVYNDNYEHETHQIASRYPKMRWLVSGGETRQESVRHAIESLTSKYVLVHDAARPLVSQRTVSECIARLRAGHVCVNTVFQPTATMVVLENGKMVGTMDRNNIALGQCPQGFVRELLLHAHDIVSRRQVKSFTDDCGLMIAAGLVEHVETVQGSLYGFKLTYPPDMDYLELCLAAVREDERVDT